MTKEEKSQYQKKYYLLNKSKIKIRHKEHYELNKAILTKLTKEQLAERILVNKAKSSAKCKSYYEKNKTKISAHNKNYQKANKEHIKKQRRSYYDKNIVTIREKERIRENLLLKTDPLFKLKNKIKTAIRSSFKYKNHVKTCKTLDILGCSFQELKKHLESKFEDWMNWDNQGLYNGEPKYGWDIDHKQPLKFAVTIEDIIRLNHYTNLQPLCSKINRYVKKDNPNFTQN